MGRHCLSETEIDEHRVRVVSAAERLFAERGFEGVTLRAIAKSVGRSHTAVYRYFSGKADIFAAARTAAYDRFAESLEQAGRETEDVTEWLDRTGVEYVRFAIREPDAYRLMFELKQPEGDRPAHLGAAEDRAFEPLHAAIQANVDANRLVGHSQELAHLFWAGLHGVVSLHLAHKLTHGCDFESLVRAMKTLLFRGGGEK